MSSINLQIRTRHKSTRITDQEHRGPPVILWLAQFPQHVLRRPCLPPFGIQLEQLLNHVGHDIAWRDGVDAYAVGFAPFGGQVACELDYGGFACVVCGTYQTLGKVIRCEKGEGEIGLDRDFTKWEADLPD